jgi:hypothetical protein
MSAARRRARRINRSPFTVHRLLIILHSFTHSLIHDLPLTRHSSPITALHGTQSPREINRRCVAHQCYRYWREVHDLVGN